MKPFNGHPSWNAWNTALWVSNDEHLYNTVNGIVKTLFYNDELKCSKDWRQRILKYATQKVYRLIGGLKTPDGGVFNARCIKYICDDFLTDLENSAARREAI